MSTLIIIGVGAIAYTISKQIPLFSEEGSFGGTVMALSFILFLVLLGFIGYWIIGILFAPLLF